MKSDRLPELDFRPPPEPAILPRAWFDRLKANRWGNPKPAGKHRRQNEAVRAKRKRERQNRRKNR